MKLLLCCLISLNSFAQLAVHEQWKELVNSNLDSIQKVYSPTAVLITPQGILYKTIQDRAVYYKNLKSKVEEIASVTTVRQEEVGHDLYFEIGYFVTNTNKKFMHLLVGKKVDYVFVREVEMLSESNSDPLDMEGINKARTGWLKLCNSHLVNELVSKAYAGNAVYYNNNRILVGTEAITTEYKYMRNPSYQLTLTPIIVETAGKDLVFEIGQCSGSYTGKYTLVWKKVEGNWKVLFDSN